MPIHLANVFHLPEIEELLRKGRHVHRTIAHEDLAHLVEEGVGVLGEDHGRFWGFLGVTVEERPETLPASAPTRARLQVAALMSGHWPSEVLPVLLGAARVHLQRSHHAVQVGVFGAESWLERPLLASGFALHDRVIVLRLTRLQRLSFEQPAMRPPAELRGAYFADAPHLAALDAETFEPIWHFAASDIVEMFMRGRVQVAVVNGNLAGYAALLVNSSSEAHLARLAVHPTYQRKGIGRQLLEDAIMHVQREGFADLYLNTQAKNLPSLALYRAAGFRPTGEEMSVLTYTVTQTGIE
jgi:ribosomal protein S18 acetylase RimI-like enzyme